ncbi:unnamed protein product [Prunus armeniaca]
MRKGVSNVKSTAPYKAYQLKPSTRLLNHGRSDDGPWISSAKSTQPRPTSTLGFWWQLTISLNGLRRSPVGPFLAHRFCIPETITADNGPVFASAETREYAKRIGIKLVHSTPYYPQSIGQAEASNKVIKSILENMIEEKPRAWHDLLLAALWAYRVSKRSATGTSPYALSYSHDAIVPMELKVRSLRVTERPGQEGKDYAQAMAQELEDLEQSRLDAHSLMQAQKPIGTKDPRLGKFTQLGRAVYYRTNSWPRCISVER